MNVNINFYGPLETWAGKKSFIAKGNTVYEVLASLETQIGKSVLEHLLTDKGDLKSHFHILLNGLDIEALNGLKTEVKDGDVITCVPPVGGG
ncbi:MoaD/ThiS family protein [Candidatus Hodarchaeum mangrovi]